MLWADSSEVENMCDSPGVVPAVGLDEVHVSVFREEGHQLVIGPEIEAKYSNLKVRTCWKWDNDFTVHATTVRAAGKINGYWMKIWNSLAKFN